MASNTDNSKSPRGVYKNPRLMHACTSMVGFTVHLQTKDGSVWEGIFNTFSPEFTICLDLAIQIDPKLSIKDCLYAALKSGQQAKEQAFFDLKDIVRITVVDIDLNWATKDLAVKGLATDADISGYDATKLSGPRQLESWQDDDEDNINDDSLLTLDDSSENKNNSRGWDAQEMFSFNERVHKVNSTYDENLQDYTIAVPKNNSKEWQRKSLQAAAIAKEIETNTKSQSRLALEDGSDEEEKYSAVVRHQPRQQQQQTHQPHQSNQPPHQQHLQHQQHQQHQSHHLNHQNPSHQNSNQQHPHQQNPNHMNPNHQNGTYNKKYRKRIDSLKTFGQQLRLAPSPAAAGDTSADLPPAPPQQPQPPSVAIAGASLDTNNQITTTASSTTATTMHSITTATQPIQVAPQASQTPQNIQQSVQAGPAGPTTTATTITTTATGAQTTQAASDTTDSSKQLSQPLSEIARKSTLNPNAKEFVYKPKSPAIVPGAQQQQQQLVASMSNDFRSMPPQASHGPYYPVFPHGLSPHQQQHHNAQFMHNHFQSQIHYMPPPPVVPQFGPQQMSPRYMGGNFQNCPPFQNYYYYYTRF